MATPLVIPVGPDQPGEVGAVMTGVGDAIEAAGGPYQDAAASVNQPAAAASSPLTFEDVLQWPVTQVENGVSAANTAISSAISSGVSSAVTAATSKIGSSLASFTFDGPGANLTLIVVGIILCVGALLISQSNTAINVVSTVGRKAAQAAEIAA